MSVALTVHGLEMRRGAAHVLRGVDIEVAPGEVVALMGLSGAGKTSVLRAIAALEPFTAGTIEVGDYTLQPGPLRPESALRSLRSRVGMVFQSHSLFEHLTVIENVMLAPMHVLGWEESRAKSQAQQLLGGLGIAERSEALPKEISGGQAQRAAIARALALDPLLLLLDEPTSALDPARRGAIAETLRRLARDGRGLLVSTHDVEFARACADRVIVLAEGRVAENGSARQILDRPQHPATRELLRSDTAGQSATS